MNKKLTLYFVSLVQDACLKSFWRKRALAAFLKKNHISDRFVEPLYQGSTKAEVLSNIFDRLAQNQDLRHQNILIEIARELVAMRTFPDLEGWEDAQTKINAAKQAVMQLRIEYEKLEVNFIDTGDEEKRAVAKLKREKAVSYETMFEDFRKRLYDLVNRVGDQKAGYDFEKWIYEFASFNDIVSRSPYKDKNGRQIDGALQIESDSMILEAKCTLCPIPVTEIDSFKAKINTKADNTLGLMVSMSGYEPGAIEAASEARSPVILIDGGHLFNIVMTRQMTLGELVSRVKRNAAQTGRAYLPVSDF